MAQWFKLIIIQGLEYYEMITCFTDYNKKHHFPILNDHPMSIYFKPMNGSIYFLRRQTLKKLGFPRLQDNQKKQFKWKKMNFQTQLPKSKPKVAYIVCSTTGSVEQFRMHIVQLFQCKDPQQYLLCHLLQMETKHSQTNKIEKPLFQIARAQWLQSIQNNNQIVIEDTNKLIHYLQEDNDINNVDRTVKRLCNENLLVQRIQNKRQELQSLVQKFEQSLEWSQPVQLTFPLSDDDIFVWQKILRLHQPFQQIEQNKQNLQSQDQSLLAKQLKVKQQDNLLRKGYEILKLTENI